MGCTALGVAKPRRFWRCFFNFSWDAKHHPLCNYTHFTPPVERSPRPPAPSSFPTTHLPPSRPERWPVSKPWPGLLHADISHPSPDPESQRLSRSTAFRQKMREGCSNMNHSPLPRITARFLGNRGIGLTLKYSFSKRKERKMKYTSLGIRSLKHY